MPRAAGASTIMTMTTAMLTESGLYRLLAWLSPSFPVGAFSYSHGIEAAVEAGQLRNRASLEAWVASILRHGAGRTDADLLRDAWRAVEENPLPLAGELCSKNPLPLAGEGRVRAPEICADGAEV